VLFGEDDYVVFPERVGVVKGEDPFVLVVDRDDQLAGQDLAAIEITGGVGHWFNFSLLPLLNYPFSWPP
jgi:hypothetical protein